jgi:DNA-binding transcriptional LysR family regulator
LEVLVTVARERAFRAADVQPYAAGGKPVNTAVEQNWANACSDRSSNGTLTDAGDLVVEYARQILNLRQNAAAAMQELRDIQFGKLTLSANEHTVFAVLPIIAEFQRRHPLVKVEVSRGVASRIPEEIASRDVELGVLSFKPKDPGIVSVNIGTDELILIIKQA